ncbi:MAG: tetratricopeptide repeat protein [Gammaproteobacteria bacterium]|nr:tetratricopeptide repeat protein [Gammaproteobacteria bacterium]NVK88280.1 tetratricopeptide repeat protein [Gammaproteobacteria bacterium]
MTMLRILALLLSAILWLGLTGCASKGGGTQVATEVTETQAGPAFLSESLPSGLQRLLTQARTAFENEQHEQAVTLLNQANSEYPDLPQADVNLAIVYMHQEQYDAANRALESALMRRANYAPALNLQGVLFRIDGQFAAARATYEQAINVEPNYANAYLNLAILADLYLQNYTLALSAFESYLALVKEDEKVTNWVIDLKRRMSEEAP